MKSNNYDAKTLDSKWYYHWINNNYFKPRPGKSKKTYSVVMPPPNVTGVLHMGHALVNTLQDVLVRWKRMNGFETLWIPGTDHAGIATQTVVERHTIKTYGKKRTDYSRQEFLSHVWDWKEKSQNTIINQLQVLGCSCDWDHLRFTMDEGNNQAVRSVFKKMYDDGLIYKGDYLVNWDPITQTALADDEVDYEEKQSFLWYFNYPLTDKSGFITVATTRPETMLGDVAVAVSPNDVRYKDLIGKSIKLPLVEREIPIIADHFVDPAFGTGAVKITPAHDPNDYEMGLRHNLCRINIMTAEGKINENGGEFVGLTMQEARIAVVEAMKKLNFLEKIEPHMNRIGISYRSKAIIEPYMSKQWFVRLSKFSTSLREAVQSEKVKLIPKNWENTYFHWIDNLRDWCISRQLWWGHRIPVWTHKEDPSYVICFDGEGVPPEVEKNPEQWEQDSDVLDTWFSSALWPFSTLGWPKDSEDLKKFYPNSVLVTGYDILFFWVARMIMMGEYVMGEVPFPEVFLNGLIYGKSYWRQNEGGGITYVTDTERREYDLGKPVPKDVFFRWEKMSKSKGNIIDPLEVIPEFGTDAVRMALCASSPQNREIDLDLRRFEEFRNFSNKVWNGSRFVYMNLEANDNEGTALTSEEFNRGLEEDLLRLEDRWILSKLASTVKEVNKSLEMYLFDQAALKAYDFFWKEFCSYYVEISKPYLFGKQGTVEVRKNKQKLLVIVLCQAIRLIHPMAPFISEEIFNHLKLRLNGLVNNSKIDPYTQECIEALNADACMVASYPQVIKEGDINEKIEKDFALVEKIIYTVRNIRGEMKVPPGTAVKLEIIGDLKDERLNFIQENAAIIQALVRICGIETMTKENNEGFACTGIVETLKIRIPLPAELVQQEKLRLEKEKERMGANLERLRQQLSNPEFIKNAPSQLVEKQKEQLRQAEEQYADLLNRL